MMDFAGVSSLMERGVSLSEYSTTYEIETLRVSLTDPRPDKQDSFACCDEGSRDKPLGSEYS